MQFICVAQVPRPEHPTAHQQRSRVVVPPIGEFTMRDIKRRLERLEQAYKPFVMGEVIVMFMSCFREGPLTAIIARVDRIGDESEDDLRHRAADEARAKLGPRDVGPGNTIMLYDVRREEDREMSRKQMGSAPGANSVSPEPDEVAKLAGEGGNAQARSGTRPGTETDAARGGRGQEGIQFRNLTRPEDVGLLDGYREGAYRVDPHSARSSFLSSWRTASRRFSGIAKFSSAVSRTSRSLWYCSRSCSCDPDSLASVTARTCVA